MSRGPRPAYAERCREAEVALRDVARLKVRGEVSRFWRLRDVARLKSAEKCREAEGGMRDVASL